MARRARVAVEPIPAAEQAALAARGQAPGGASGRPGSGPDQAQSGSRSSQVFGSVPASQASARQAS